MKLHVNKYIKLLAIAMLSIGIISGLSVCVQAKIVARSPMKIQFSLEEIKDKCIRTVHRYKDARSKVTVNERKVMCLINFAKLGQVNAEYLLGKVYAKAQKLYQAVDWLKKSFLAHDASGIYIGNPEAGFEIGTLYLNAYLFNRKQSSLDKSFEWLEKSALRGSKYAKVGLARLYLKYKKFEKAYIWYKVASVDYTKIKHPIRADEKKDFELSISDAQKDKVEKKIKHILSELPIRIER